MNCIIMISNEFLLPHMVSNLGLNSVSGSVKCLYCNCRNALVAPLNQKNIASYVHFSDS